MHLWMMKRGKGQAGCHSKEKAKENETVKDPVCGMEKPKSEFKFTSEYKGKTYYFCSKQCQHMFEASPRGYAGK